MLLAIDFRHISSATRKDVSKNRPIRQSIPAERRANRDWTRALILAMRPAIGNEGNVAEENESAGRRRSRAVVVTALGTSQTLAWASSYYLPAILADPISTGLGVPRSWVFASFSASLLIAAFAGPAVGRIIDRYGGRGVLVLSNLVFAGGLAALAAANGAFLPPGWLSVSGRRSGSTMPASRRSRYSRTSDQRSDQAQQFLFFWPATSRNKKGFDLNISDLAISYCTTS
jgi:hypothetical protein